MSTGMPGPEQLVQEVAQSIPGCLDLAPTCEGTAAPCAEKAIAQARDDSTATSYCSTLLACDGGGAPDAGALDGGRSVDAPDAGALDGGRSVQEECTRIAKALAQTGRDALKSCVAGGWRSMHAGCYGVLRRP